MDSPPANNNPGLPLVRIRQRNGIGRGVSFHKKDHCVNKEKFKKKRAVNDNTVYKNSKYNE